MAAIGLFILAPIVVVLGSSLTSAEYVTFPPVGLSFRWFADLPNQRGLIDSFIVSIQAAIATAIVATVLGTAAAIGMARAEFRGTNLLATFFISPLMLPTLVIGLALLIFSNGLNIPRSLGGVVIGHVIITIPFVIRFVGASLAGYDQNLGRAAASLGASPFVAFRRITLPLIQKGILAGAAFAAIVSFDDVSIAIFMSSRTQTTLPVRIFGMVEEGYPPSVMAISSITIVLMVGVLIAVERALGVGRFYGLGSEGD